jgi:methylamine--corrinoid protein Co-methyltransferase
MVDCLGAGSVSTYFGERIMPGTPLEILGARRDAVVAREAIRMAGRPGMHINDVALPLTCAGKMAALDQETGLRACDGILISQMINVKTDFDQLSRVAHLYNTDGIRVGLMHPLIGGVGGGAEGSAVVAIACVLLSIVIYDADYHMFSPGHLKHSNNVDPVGAWLNAVCGQALARNTQSVMLNDIFAVSGPGTKEVLYEAAVGAIVGTISGFNIQGVGTASGFNADVVTGLEARFVAEISRAVIKQGMSREAASEFIPGLQKKFMHAMENPNRGLPFPEVYDEETVEPKEFWLEMYQEVKEEISRLGLKLD